MSAQHLFEGWKGDDQASQGNYEWRTFVRPFLIDAGIAEGGTEGVVFWSASVRTDGWFPRLYWSLMAEFLPGRPHDYIRILQESWDLGRPTPEAEARLTLKRMSE